jgi:outer membrane protein TolC
MGLAARNEVLAVEVERDRAELARLRADNAADLAAAVLARLLDLAPDARFEPADSLEQDRQPVPDTETLVGRALEARPERMVLEARLSAAKWRAGAARAARRPQLSLSGGYDYANPNRRILPYEEAWEDSWDVGVSMSFNIFDAGRSVAQEARFDASALAIERRLEELDRLIRLEVTSRSLDLRSAESSIEVAGRALESAAENLRVARDRYREGLIPSSELLDAEVAMMQAGLERTDSLARQRMARAALERAVGE